MKLEQLRKHWDAFGKVDPLWAICTDADHKNGRWDLAEFLQTGRDEVAELMDHLAQLRLDFPKREALDFGCGIGRLTQVLCVYFESCVGVDIAPSMIEQARRLNEHGDRCSYQVNDAADLSLFPPSSFDFVLSLITLQHMEPKYSKRYIAEFLRVLRPGGVTVFQVPWGLEIKPAADLPEGAWSARLEVEDIPERLEAKEAVPVSVRVRNASAVTWPHTATIRVGNHWLDRNGRTVVQDDARAAISRDVAPGGETSVILRITPPRPGPHLLELDLVQEGVSWFSQRGSEPARVPVQVGRRRALRRMLGQWSHNGEDVRPVMEMHCLPQEDVNAVVNAGGGVIVDTIDKDMCGGGYQSLHYIVRKER
ncbi:MAG TPA: class I SAM-dependent methyltransferase [Candidatus Sulfotelmatobacter sp.]|nr:class I SAM-dependent methyltransferase [Candidatus Sulfotelmatobacter sp.]